MPMMLREARSQVAAQVQVYERSNKILVRRRKVKF